MRAGLAEAQAARDPLRQFERWFDDALRAKLPAGAVGTYIIDPNGFVILRYAPGTNLMGLREDLSKLLKLL